LAIFPTLNWYSDVGLLSEAGLKYKQIENPSTHPPFSVMFIPILAPSSREVPVFTPYNRYTLVVSLDSSAPGVIGASGLIESKNHSNYDLTGAMLSITSGY